MHTFYILFNSDNGKVYTGIAAADERQILEEYRQGKAGAVFSEKPKPYPYFMLHKEKYADVVKAQEREAFYKTAKGKRLVKEYILSFKQWVRESENSR